MRLCTVALFALLTLAASVEAQEVFDLKIGDPERAHKTVPLLLDGIVATTDGAVLTVDEVVGRLADVRLLLIGESHTSIDFHRAQHQMIQALTATGRPVLIGLEMYPVTQQEQLERWSDERLSEQEFVESSRWYEHWSYNWGYYRDIFVDARRAGARFVAVNAPRDAVTAVRTKGFDNLSEHERRGVAPSIDTDSADHLTLFKSYFSDGDATHSAMSDEQWESMFAAQVTWDASMAYNAVHALESQPHDAIMVIIVGSGHVSYGLGIARQAANFFDGRSATLIPVPVSDTDGRPRTTVSAAYADFVWGIPGETDTLYPRLGLSTRMSDDALTVLFAETAGLGATGGIAAGDIILRVDDRAIPDKETFNRLLAAKRWGDVVTLTVERDGSARNLEIALRRSR